MEVLKEYGAALIGLGFIYFIAIRLMRNLNNKKKALFVFIVGFVISLIFGIAIVYDCLYVTTPPKFSFYSEYYAFIIVSVLLMIIVPGVLLLIGCSRHERFRSYQNKIKFNQEKAKPTIKDIKEGVYVIIKHNGNFLLKKSVVSGIEQYGGVVEKLNNKVLFHDEMIKEIIAKYEINEGDIHNVVEYKLVGEATVKSKKDFHYYCYIIDINYVCEKLKEFYEVSPYDLVKYNMNDFDKQVIYHIVLRDYFKIEL